MPLFDKRLYQIWNEIMPNVQNSIFEPVYEIVDSKETIVDIKVKEEYVCPEELGKDCKDYLNMVVAKDLFKALKSKVYDPGRDYSTGCPICKERAARNLVLNRIKQIYKKSK